jgi:hypothetical protein
MSMIVLAVGSLAYWLLAIVLEWSNLIPPVFLLALGLVFAFAANLGYFIVGFHFSGRTQNPR